jgi:hypothetical protein
MACNREDPTLPRHSAHRWWRSCQPYVPAALYSLQTICISASGTHYYYSLTKLQGLVRPEGIGELIKFNYVIGYRTRDLLVCSLVPGSLKWAQCDVEWCATFHGYRLSRFVLFLLRGGQFGYVCCGGHCVCGLLVFIYWRKP